MRPALPPSSAVLVQDGFSALTCHVGRGLDVQHTTGFVIAFQGRFLTRVVFASREDAQDAAIGQSNESWDDLVAEGWSVEPVRAEITRVNA